MAAATSIPVVPYDERLTTVTATRLLKEGSVPGRSQRQMVDQVAAAVMLQAWLDRRATQSDT
jgi:putative Holliday junction resolvase